MGVNVGNPELDGARPARGRDHELPNVGGEAVEKWPDGRKTTQFACGILLDTRHATRDTRHDSLTAPERL
jgi:hypothetical protein